MMTFQTSSKKIFVFLRAIRLKAVKGGYTLTQLEERRVEQGFI